MTGNTAAFIIALMTSEALFTFIIFMIKRRDEQKNRLSKQEEEIEIIRQEQEKQSLALLRLQMMELMRQEDSAHELLLVAEEYFGKGGDWYMTSLFNRHLEKNKIAKPEWFKEEKQ
ncbi:MAG: hypothetical protein MJ086_03355 [Lachnospiraceae bacterium]|nr:hypothetical protein [Lachnospiraceae bacterium]